MSNLNIEYIRDATESGAGVTLESLASMIQPGYPDDVLVVIEGILYSSKMDDLVVPASYYVVEEFMNPGPTWILADEAGDEYWYFRKDAVDKLIEQKLTS